MRMGAAAGLPWFERALATAPHHADLLYDYAATLGEVGRARDMLAILRRLHDAAPGDRRIYFLKAVLAARAGKIDLAGTLLQRTDPLTWPPPPRAFYRQSSTANKAIMRVQRRRWLGSKPNSPTMLPSVMRWPMRCRRAATITSL